MNAQHAISIDIIDEKIAATLLGFSRSQLQKWRWLGTGPSYFRIGKAIRYSKNELEQWLASQRRQPS